MQKRCFISPNQKVRAKPGDMIIDMELQRPLINGSKSEPLSKGKLELILKNDDGDSLQLVMQQNANDPYCIFDVANAPKRSTVFHSAVEHSELQNCSCLKVLLNSTIVSEYVNRPDINSFTPLHYAAKLGKVEALKLLLAEPSVQVNSRDDINDTALHVLAKYINDSNSPQSAMILCLDELLGHRDIDLEPRNNVDHTPLMIPVVKMSGDGHKKIDNAVLTFCRRLVSKGASLEARSGNNPTIEEMLEEKRAKSSVFMCDRQPAPPRPMLSVLMDTLILNGDISQNKFDKVIKEASNMWLGSSTILYYAVDKSNYSAVKALLEAGADPAYTNDKGEIIALHRAIARGNIKILKLLIEFLKKKHGVNKAVDLSEHSFNILNELLVGINHKKTKNSDPDINYLECLKVLLAGDVILDVNQVQDSSVQKTPLYVAASLNNQDALKLLLIAGAHLGTKCIINDKDYGNVLPALRPETLTKAMDKCIKQNDSKDVPAEQSVLDPNYSLLLDYNFLIPSHQKEDKDIPCELETVMDIKKNKQHRRSLTHPLVQVLLYIKWMKILPFYLINLSVFFLFLITLTWFMYSLKDLRILQTRQAANLTGYNLTANSTIEEEITHYYTSKNVALVFLLPLTVYILIREIFQIWFTRKAYFKNIENYLEVFLISVVIILSCFTLNAEWTRHLAAWAVIAAGYEFVLILGRVPSLAIYVTMLRNVAWNFLRMIFLYGSLIIVFAFSFNIILYPTMPSEDAGDFSTFWTTLPKSIVMATGEFEYSDLSKEFSVDVIFATSAVLLFLSFVFLIFLVLLNIMTGLAVTDTAQIMEDATLYSLTSRLELIYLVEKLFRITPILNKILYLLLVFPRNDPRKLIVFFNKYKKSERIQLLQMSKKCRLDNITADTIRNHWIEKMQEKPLDQPNPLESRLTNMEELMKQIEIKLTKM